MNGEGKLRTELTKTGIPSYEWPSLDGQVTRTQCRIHPQKLKVGPSLLLPTIQKRPQYVHRLTLMERAHPSLRRIWEEWALFQ